MSKNSDEAYTVTATNGIVEECSCLAAEYGDPVCKHRAMLWHKFGTLYLPEQDVENDQD